MYNTLSLIKNYLEKSFLEKEKSMNSLGYVNVTLAPIEKEGQKEGEDIVITLLRVEEETSRKPQNVFQYGIDAQDGKRKAMSKRRNPDVFQKRCYLRWPFATRGKRPACPYGLNQNGGQ